jgi:hypothetical protein
MRTWENNKTLVSLFAIVASVGVVYPQLERVPRRAIVGGDQSQYAKATIDLYQSWQHGPKAWWLSMAESMKSKPPILPWIGQLFLPFRVVLGSTDGALLYGVSLISILGLLGLFIATRKLSKTTISPSTYAILIAASSPLFQYLFNEYLVEPIQFFVVCWFILIIAYSKSWDRSMLLAQLMLGSSIALLSKASSPSYVIFPGILAVYFLFKREDEERSWNLSFFKNWFALASALVVGFATSAWYAKNYAAVKAHVIAATTGSVAAFWGKEDSYFNTMAYWLDAIRDSFFNVPVLWIYLVVFAAGFFCFFSKRPVKVGFFDICALAGIAQLVLSIILFSFSSNREVRYLLALLPYFALVGAWGLHHVGNRNFRWGICLAILGLWLLSNGVRYRAGNDLANSKILAEIVQLAFPQGRLSGTSHSVVAIDPECRGDWLTAEPANYEAAKFALANRIANGMKFHYLGGGFFGSDWDATWKHLLAIRPQSIFIISPDSPELSKVKFNRALKGENSQKFYQALENRVLFHEPKKLSLDGSILVYYPTKDFDRLAAEISQLPKPNVDLALTRQLFESAKIISINKPTGKVEFRENQGILIHPSCVPTVIEVDLRTLGKSGKVELAGWISYLPPAALDEYSGIVRAVISNGARNLVDQLVTRRANLNLLVDLEKTPSLKISVDMGNGTASFDWFFLGVTKK